MHLAPRSGQVLLQAIHQGASLRNGAGVGEQLERLAGGCHAVEPERHGTALEVVRDPLDGRGVLSRHRGPQAGDVTGYAGKERLHQLREQR